MTRAVITCLAIAIVFALAACSERLPGHLLDARPPGDGDTDTDTDGDADYVGDDDWPADPETDEDHSWGPSMRGVGLARCYDGTDDTVEGFVDCERIECMTTSSCCLSVAGSTVSGDFGSCDDLATCGWSAFLSGEDDSAVALDPADSPWVALGGDGVGEVGLYTDAGVLLRDRPVATFVAALDPETCLAGSCRQGLGVALVGGDPPTGSTGVQPRVGILLDGELEVIHLHVDGRPVAELPADLATLTTPHTYAFEVRPDGRVGFWAARPASDPPTTEGIDLGEADFTTSTEVAAGGGRQHLVLYGRLLGDGAGRVAAVRLERRVCDGPGNLDVRSGPVRTAVVDGGRVGRPAVCLRDLAGPLSPWETELPPLLMVFETADGLAAATSWDGESWRFVRRVLRVQAPTQYGRVARRAPALVHWGPPGGDPEYHLFYEGVSEEGPGATAILHATSDDGMEWYEVAEDNIVIEGTLEPTWDGFVGEPTVVARGDELIMWYIARDPASGVRSLARATSTDGKEWTLDAAAVTFEPSEPESFERDGLGQPAALLRGDRVHLWYTGLAGSRASIGAAVAADPEGTIFVRLGLEHEPTRPWEGRRATGPAALVYCGEPWDSEVGRLQLWYAAGPEGAESVGLATRDLPAW